MPLERMERRSMEKRNRSDRLDKPLWGVMTFIISRSPG